MIDTEWKDGDNQQLIDDSYTDGWESHKRHVLEIIQTMADEGVEYAGALEDFHFRLLSR
jgi:hypothetical protein|tara:strand:- start:1096 stop:1272 length:177 start_codon:yes stop_codon:yes gene_type:complete